MRGSRRGSGSHRARLGSLEGEEAKASPRVREAVELLVDPDARVRARGLDAVSDLLLRGGGIDAAGEAIPYLGALATSRGYPEASALLVRLASALASADDPPRSNPSEAFRVLVPSLLRLARTATDPEAARVAACMVAHFPEADAEAEPVLIALLSGARDSVERSRVLYALTRVQATRGGAFHGRVADALHREALDEEVLSVALALAEHDPPEPLRGRLARTLANAEDRGFSDPSGWGRALANAALARALAALAG